MQAGEQAVVPELPRLLSRVHFIEQGIVSLVARARDGAPARPFANPNALDFAIVQEPFLSPLPPAPTAAQTR